MCLCFLGDKLMLDKYTDVDMIIDINSGKSGQGYIIYFSKGAISWSLKLQKCVPLFLTEDEFIMKKFATKRGLS